METFLDGGLFEILIAMFFAVTLNFIFLKKYLLVIYSVLIIAAPAMLFLVNKNDLYYWLVTLCLFNSVFLVVLLWKAKNKDPQGTLFNIESIRNKLSGLSNRFSTFLKNK